MERDLIVRWSREELTEDLLEEKRLMCCISAVRGSNCHGRMIWQNAEKELKKEYLFDSNMFKWIITM